MYQTEWNAKIKSELKASHERRPGALVQDMYAMVLKCNDETDAHVPKSLSKITYFVENPEKISS